MEKIIARVRKMLALANDKAATEGERDNALRMAHATLAKYNLDIAVVESSSGKTNGSVAPRVRHYTTFYGRPWARLVSQGVAELMFCHYLFSTATKSKDTVHYFVGSHANAVSASMMSEFLVGSIMREGKRFSREHGLGNAGFRSFAIGAAGSIVRRCAELREAAERPAPASPATGLAAPGTNVVLASVYASERAANAVVVAGMRPRQATGYAGKKEFIADAAEAGAEYGSTVSLNRQVE